jgi:ABC-2 type transport system ATP-binding protein
LQSLSFVREAKAIDNKILVTLDDPEAHNPEIIRILVGLGAEIQFVGELRHSLEDVYFQLVKNA